MASDFMTALKRFINSGNIRLGCRPHDGASMDFNIDVFLSPEKRTVAVVHTWYETLLQMNGLPVTSIK